MFFQGRGKAYLQEINTDGSLDAAVQICTDSLNVGLATDAWTHINRCEAVDVEDARGTKSNSATITLALADMADVLLALGVLGLVQPAGSPGSVAAEELPASIPDGSYWFCGGATRHRNITALVITGMTVTTDYTLDAETGRITFVGDQSASPPPTMAYNYTDPQYVSLLTAGQKEYFMSYEFLNKQNANKKGSYEFYKVRLDPTDNLDLQSEANQSMTLKGSVLADTSRSSDDELGQFGRRIL